MEEAREKNASIPFAAGQGRAEALRFRGSAAAGGAMPRDCRSLRGGPRRARPKGGHAGGPEPVGTPGIPKDGLRRRLPGRFQDHRLPALLLLRRIVEPASGAGGMVDGPDCRSAGPLRPRVRACRNGDALSRGLGGALLDLVTRQGCAGPQPHLLPAAAARQYLGKRFGSDLPSAEGQWAGRLESILAGRHSIGRSHGMVGAANASYCAGTRLAKATGMLAAKRS